MLPWDESYGLPLQALPHCAGTGAGPGCMVADWMPVHLNTAPVLLPMWDEQWPSALPPSACTLVR